MGNLDHASPIVQGVKHGQAGLIVVPEAKPNSSAYRLGAVCRVGVERRPLASKVGNAR